MARACGTAVGRQGDVDPFLAQHPRVAVGLQLGGASGQRRRHATPGLADALARLGLLGGLQAADRAVRQGERAPVTGVGEPSLLQGVQVTGSGERGEGVRHGGVDAGCVQRGQRGRG